jgi:hypothetical protein
MNKNVLRQAFVAAILGALFWLFLRSVAPWTKSASDANGVVGVMILATVLELLLAVFLSVAFFVGFRLSAPMVLEMDSTCGAREHGKLGRIFSPRRGLVAGAVGPRAIAVRAKLGLRLFEQL